MTSNSITFAEARNIFVPIIMGLNKFKFWKILSRKFYETLSSLKTKNKQKTLRQTLTPQCQNYRFAWLLSGHQKARLSQSQRHSRVGTAISMTSQSWHSDVIDTPELTQWCHWHRRVKTMMSLTSQSWHSDVIDTAELTQWCQRHSRVDTATWMTPGRFWHMQVSPWIETKVPIYFSICKKGLRLVRIMKKQG